MAKEIKTIEVVQGDITKLNVEAIVNAANNSLRGGGGVDGAIHRAGGEVIHKECMVYIALNGKLPTGDAMITSGGKLPAKYVIHTVGPVWMGGKQDEPLLLANAYKNSLKLASEYNIRSIAFPNISTGVYGYPKVEAARVAIDTVSEFLKSDNKFEKVIFCCWDYENYALYTDYMNERRKSIFL